MYRENLASLILLESCDVDSVSHEYADFRSFRRDVYLSVEDLPVLVGCCCYSHQELLKLGHIKSVIDRLRDPIPTVQYTVASLLSLL